jgi:hypothetical protein
MDFFTAQDWFGRPGPFAYNTDYIIFIVLSILGIGAENITSMLTVTVILSLIVSVVSALVGLYGFAFPYLLEKYGYLTAVKRPAITENDIVEALRQLGITQDDVLLVHASTSKCGYIEGGAKTVIEARKNGEFLSIEDLTQRTQLNGTNVKMLEKLGVLKDMQPKNQLELDLF